MGLDLGSIPSLGFGDRRRDVAAKELRVLPLDLVECSGGEECPNPTRGVVVRGGDARFVHA